MSYLQRWRHLSGSARLYLLHAALLTFGLAIVGLFFNLLLLALGYPLTFVGQLNALAAAVAALLSLPLWWLASQIGLRTSLLASALLQAASTAVFVLWPTTGPLVLSVACTGVAAVLFQVSAAPFMMQHSSADARDHLFSANTAINIGLGGIGSLVAGVLPGWLGGLLHAGAESATAYRATYAVATVGIALSIVPLLLIRNGRSEQEGGERGSSPAPSLQPQALVDVEHVRGWTPMAALMRRVPAPWRALLRRPGMLLRLLISPFLISWGAALLIPYLNLFFKQRFAVADSVLGLIFAALGIATGLAALLGPLISVRLGKMGTIVAVQLVSIPFLFVLGFVPILGVAVGAALVRASLFNMGGPLYDAFAMERTTASQQTLVIGLIYGAYSVGYLVAPALSTVIQERYGFAPLFVMTATCYGLAALANYYLLLRAPSDPVEPLLPA